MSPEVLSPRCSVPANLFCYRQDTFPRGKRQAGPSFSANDTAPRETPAFWAISTMVTRPEERFLSGSLLLLTLRRPTGSQPTGRVIAFNRPRPDTPYQARSQKCQVNQVLPSSSEVIAPLTLDRSRGKAPRQVPLGKGTHDQDREEGQRTGREQPGPSSTLKPAT